MLKDVNPEQINRLYSLRSNLEKNCDKAMEEVHATLLKSIAELPMQGFDENVLSKVRFNLEIGLKGDLFSYTLKHEIV